MHNLPLPPNVPPAHATLGDIVRGSDETVAIPSGIPTNRFRIPPSDRRSELQGLCPVQLLEIDHRLDHDIHFSPDGKRLAISTPSGLIIYDVGQYGNKPAPIRVDGRGFFFEQFTWSPDSSHIVIFGGTGILVWNKDTVSNIPGSIGCIFWHSLMQLWRTTKGWKKHQPPGRVKAIIGLQAPSQFFVVLDREPHILVSTP